MTASHASGDSESLFSPEELAALRPLAAEYPSLDAVAARIAVLTAELQLPKPSVHVISDVHGEAAKLRHVVNNASGTLRPLVERLFAGELSPSEIAEFLKFVFYPKEAVALAEPQWTSPDEQFVSMHGLLLKMARVIRALQSRATSRRLNSLLPAELDELLRELLLADPEVRGPGYFAAIVRSLVDQGRAKSVVRHAAHLLRNLTIDELILAGDCWDRGPRGDQVVGYLLNLPNVVFTWGNHDAAWIGAALGHAASLAQVLRISCRYRRLSQLEEGYGVTLQPLERLARIAYANDPAVAFMPRGTGLRDPLQVARMQKAAAVLQHKLEGQLIARRPEFDLQHRQLLHRINLQTETVSIDGREYSLRDTLFPTVDWSDPYALSPLEEECLGRLRKSFVTSDELWKQVQFLVRRGSMYLVRDGHLIFHACVPADESGTFLEFPIDGRSRSGRELFTAIERVVVRSLDQPSQSDLDLIWYLGSGPRSPLFGKDKIATFEADFVADPAASHETKNAYFRLIHERGFCQRVLAEFGVNRDDALIVNGHVPVKVDAGESPLKRSGMAVTIDGAFSEAYGDRGYTLVLQPERTFLAEHHHFESVAAAVRDGVDIIPALTEIRTWESPRCTGDTELGVSLRAELEWLNRLAEALRSNQIPPAS